MHSRIWVFLSGCFGVICKFSGGVWKGEKYKREAIIKRATAKALLLIAFIIVAIYVVRFTFLKEFLKQKALCDFLESMGFWAPLTFILVYAAGVCLFIPGTLLTALGAAIFGAYCGFLYIWIGAMAGASAAFWIGRTLGREFAASVIGNRLRKYDEAIERNGFATVLY
jgi:uncharacterized membrane protein YdjX (TVP38/TMEM64 family)